MSAGGPLAGEKEEEPVAKKHCVPCEGGGVEALDEAVATERAASTLDGWEVTQNQESVFVLQRRITHAPKDGNPFTRSLALVNAIGAFAE